MLGGLRYGEGKQFFFEKKNQKTFAHLGTPCVQGLAPWAKVFASFYKKKRFLAYRRAKPPSPACGSLILWNKQGPRTRPKTVMPITAIG